MIYCNTKVLMVDFNVRQSESYPFFIEDELCEVQIKRKPDHFHYHFHINEEADTPRNRIRKKVNKKHRRQTITFFSCIGLLVMILATIAIRYDSRLEASREQALMREASHYTAGRIVSIEETKKKAIIHYAFSVNGRAYRGQKEIPKGGLSSLYPVANQDEFAVRFVWFRPSLNAIELENPSKEQIGRYFEQTVDRHQELHPELSKTQVVCLIDLAYEVDSLPGLAKFYLQDLSPPEHPVYNSDSYQRLIRDLPFKRKAEERCW